MGIEIEAVVTDLELVDNVHVAFNQVQSQRILLKKKGFLTYGGPLLPKLCGGLMWERNIANNTTTFVQVLDECPSKNDLELNDPTGWPDQCPTMTPKGSTAAGLLLSRWHIYLKCSLPYQIVLKSSYTLRQRLSKR